MARKVKPPRPASASAPSGADASDLDELDALFPERTIPVAGEQVTVGELGFAQGLRLAAVIAPIVQAIEEQMVEAERAPGYDGILGILGQHWSATLTLLQELTGKPADWFERLSAADGELLLLTFWNVNAGFFYQRAGNAAAVRRETRRLLDGASSTPPSAPTATATPNSAATASAS